MLPYYDALTREENRLMVAYEFNHRILRTATDAGEVRFHTRKLASIREEMLQCPNMDHMCPLLRLFGMMPADEYAELKAKRASELKP
jgi:hypothetical protein